MKKIIPLLIGLFLLSSCLKEDTASVAVPLQIQAVLPAGQGTIDFANLSVRVQSKSAPITYEKHFNAQGFVELQIEPGRYSASVSTKMADGTVCNALYNDFLLTDAGIVTADGSVLPNVITLQLEVAVPGQILFREIYYVGSKTNEGANYLKDQYFELYNNAGNTVYLDSLCFGAVNPANGKSSVYSWRGKDTVAMFSMVWMIPGTGHDYPLAPGASAVIALNAIDHSTRCTSKLNLSKAHFGIYDPNLTGHEKAPDVPAMVRIITGQGTSYAVSISSPAVVIFRPSMGVQQYLNNPAKWERYEPGKTSGTKYWHIAKEWILDGVECSDGPAINVKRFPVSVDAGFAYMRGGEYSAKAMHRKVEEVRPDRIIYQDTNNSTDDFETDVTPAPRLKP